MATFIPEGEVGGPAKTITSGLISSLVSYGMISGSGLTVGIEIYKGLKLILDIADPYGYNSIISRNFLDTQSSLVYDIIKKHTDNNISKCNASLTSKYPKADTTTIDNICKANYSMFTIAYPKTPDFKPDVCYGFNPKDYGPPKPDCVDGYSKYYNKYINNNTHEYETNNIVTSDKISSILNLKFPDQKGKKNTIDISSVLKNVKISIIVMIFLIIVILIIGIIIGIV